MASPAPVALMTSKASTAPEGEGAAPAPKEEEQEQGSEQKDPVVPKQEEAATPNESEAETEIISGSQKPTPAKRDRARSDVSGHRRKPTQDDKTGDTVSSASDVLSRIRKRKASDSHETNVSAFSKLHGRRAGSSETARESRSKKARLSPDEGSSSEGENSEVDEEEADEDGDFDDHSSAPSRKGRLRKATSGTDSSSRPHKSRRDHITALDLSNPASRHANKASSATSDAHPRSPLLRSSHRRSSSFHSSIIANDRETRLRRRFASHQSPPATDPAQRASSQPAMSKNVDRYGQTPLARACAEKDENIEKVKSILATVTEKSYLDIPDNAGNTPIQTAALNGHTDIVQILVDRGADVNNVNGAGDTPLKDAKDNEHWDVVKILEDAGASMPDSTISRSQLNALPKNRHLYQELKPQYLIDYVKKGDLETAGQILEMYNMVPDNDCVVTAVRGTDPSGMLSLMIAYGGDADPDPEDVEDFETPMVAAIDEGSVSAVQFLLNSKVDPTRLVGEGKIPYHTYAKNMHKPSSNQMFEILHRAWKGTETPNGEPTDASKDTTEGPSDEVPEPVMAPAASGPRARRLVSGAERAEQERARYAETLPAGLRHWLGKELPTVEYAHGSPDAHLRTVHDFLPILTTPLSEIDASASASASASDSASPTDLYVMGYVASLLLGHDRLDKLRDLVSDTRPISQRDRRAAFTGILFESLGETYAFERAGREGLERAQNLAPQCLDTSNMPLCWTFDWSFLWDETRQKWEALPDEQCFWVRLEDLRSLVAAEERLKGVRVRARRWARDAELGPFVAV